MARDDYLRQATSQIENYHDGTAFTAKAQEPSFINLNIHFRGDSKMSSSRTSDQIRYGTFQKSSKSQDRNVISLSGKINGGINE